MKDDQPSGAGIPGYLRPPPRRVAGLTAGTWTVAIGAAALTVIEVLPRAGVVAPIDLVPVTAMAPRAVELLADPEFLGTHLSRTGLTVLLSFVLAAVLGVATAYLMARSKIARRALNPYVGIFYAVPTFALYPVLVVIFGTGALPIILLATAFSVVVVISNSLVGFQSAAAITLKMSRSLGLSPWQHFHLVMLPAARPDILAGLKLALSYAIISVLAMEFILSPQGLGHFISVAFNSFNTTDMYAAMLIVIVLALAANLGLSALVARLDWRRW